MTDEKLVQYCDDFCDTTAVNYNQFSDRVRELCRRFRALKDRMDKVHSIGAAYVPPADWNSSKAGGPPGIEDYEEIDLSSI